MNPTENCKKKKKTMYYALSIVNQFIEPFGILEEI